VSTYYSLICTVSRVTDVKVLNSIIKYNTNFKTFIGYKLCVIIALSLLHTIVNLDKAVTGLKRDDSKRRVLTEEKWMHSVLSLLNSLERLLQETGVSSLLCFRDGTLSCECEHFTDVKEHVHNNRHHLRHLI
jgi:hypothetical protein